MTPQSTAREIHRALRQGDNLWALKMTLQGQTTCASSFVVTTRPVVPGPPHREPQVIVGGTRYWLH